MTSSPLSRTYPPSAEYTRVPSPSADLSGPIAQVSCGLRTHF